ncbi:adenylylsulfate kinase family protein [Hibiscus syriacus]|uniref:Adenylylsulfate kinase family protein n=2 Tax=Hibiscus syriacus TaxID=106335 RepID=A0A6A2WX63_HIBSY|nr:adenylylsulfate kinase family protein [Hibiscus syriacus]
MEKEEKSQRACKTIEPEVFLQWGNRKRLRCVRVKDPQKISYKSSAVIRRRITSANYNHGLTRNSEAAILRSDHRKASSPEKEDRYYTTRGSSAVDENGKTAVDSGNNGEDKKGVVWPKLFITLSSKEKEEDFMAMKGCKPPQRPKKRAKIIQRTLLLVSPGAWLTDMCQERYEVREKKSSKKRPRGLKAMGSVESDSD